MKRRNLLAMTLTFTGAGLIFSGCGSGKGGNNPDPTATPTPQTGDVAGRIVLPAGMSIDGMKARTVLGTQSVKSDGTFTVTIQDGGPTLSVAQGPSGKPMLYGFAKSGRADLSARTTAEVLVFMAAGAVYAPGVMHPVFVEGLSKLGILAATEKAVSDLLIAHGENWMDVANAKNPALKAALITDTKAFRPTVTRGSIVQPINKVSGIIVESDGVGTTFLTNYYRRRAFYYVTRESYKDSAGVTKTSFQKIVDPGVSLSPIKGATNSLVTIAEYLGGDRSFLAPVKSDAISLPLSPSDAKSTLYKVTAVGLGASAGDFDKLDTQQQADWTDTALRTLVIDLIVPIITGLVLPQMGSKIDNFLKFSQDGVTGTFIKDIINALAAQPDIITKAKSGNAIDAAYDGFLVLTGSETLKLGLFKAFYEFLSLDSLAKDYSIFMAESLEKANAILAGIDLALQVIDTGFQVLDIANSQNATQWDVLITPAKISITPDFVFAQKGVASQPITVKAVDFAPEPGQALVYKWSCERGILTAGAQSGKTIESSSDTATYTSNEAAGTQDTIRVEVSLKGVGARV
jgi:hypothetical protein